MEGQFRGVSKGRKLVALLYFGVGCIHDGNIIFMVFVYSPALFDV